MIPPLGCRSYIVSAMAVGPNGKEKINASCGPQEFLDSITTVDCTEYSTQIQQDLVLVHEMDVFKLEGGCFPFREYAVQVDHLGVTSNNYAVTIQAKYVCSTSSTSFMPCASTPNPPLGPGQNDSEATPGAPAPLGPGGCLGINYRNDSGDFALPNCCDNDLGNIAVAVQCASFTVDLVNGMICDPMYQSLQAIDMDGGTATFGCNFYPGNVST